MLFFVLEYKFNIESYLCQSHLFFVETAYFPAPVSISTIPPKKYSPCSSIAQLPCSVNENISPECAKSTATNMVNEKTIEASFVLNPIIISRGATNSPIITPYATK